MEDDTPSNELEALHKLRNNAERRAQKMASIIAEQVKQGKLAEDDIAVQSLSKIYPEYFTDEGSESLQAMDRNDFSDGPNTGDWGWRRDNRDGGDGGDKADTGSSVRDGKKSLDSVGGRD